LFAAIASFLILAIFVGAQIWVDWELADKAFDAIEEIDAKIAEIDRQLRTLASEPDLEELSLESRRRELLAKRLILQFEAMTVLTNVNQLRFIRSNESVLVLGRARVFVILASSLASGQPELAKAVATKTLANYEAGTSLLDYSPSDINRLRALQAEANAAITKRSERSH
jgi:hypothetical protein